MLSKLKSRYVKAPIRQFVGRTDELQSLAQLTERYIDGVRSFNVVSLYGMAGIGKTALLKQYLLNNESAVDVASARIIYMDLGADDYPSSLACMMSLFKALSIQAPLFEYALARIYSGTGMVTKPDLDAGVYDDSSFFRDLLLSDINTSRSTTPLSLFETLLRSCDRPYVLSMNNLHAERFAIIDRMSDFELQLNLPCFLGMAVSDACQPGKLKFIFIYDSYERIQLGVTPPNKKLLRDWWLKEFIASAETGLHIVSGRDAVKWHLNSGEWDGYLIHKELDVLPIPLVADFLRATSVYDEALINNLSRTTKGLPLYMDLIASNNHNFSAGTLPDFEVGSWLASSQKPFSHLGDSESKPIIACSLLKSFDEVLLARVYALFGLDSPTLDEMLISSSYELTSSSYSPSKFKVNDIISAYCRFYAPEGMALNVVGLLLAYSSELLDSCSASESLQAFLQVLQVLEGYEYTLSEHHHNDVLNLGIQLIESGFWMDINESLAYYAMTANANNPLPSIQLLTALCLRKKGDLAGAISLYDELLSDLSALGKWRTMAQYYHSHCLQMQDKYDEALSGYQHILNQERTVKSSIAKKSMLLARRQVAEISAIRGDFVSALNEVDDLLMSSATPIDNVRLLRLKGDIYRFNLMFEESYTAYEQALVVAAKNDFKAMQVRLLINLAESTCWHTPDIAQKHISYASELNLIEVVPCQSIRLNSVTAVSLFADGEYRESISLCEQIAMIRPRDDCTTAWIFSDQTLLILSGCNNTEISSMLLEGIQTKISATQSAYQFLLDTALLVSKCNEHSCESVRDQYQWLDFDRTISEVDFISSTILKHYKAN